MKKLGLALLSISVLSTSVLSAQAENVIKKGAFSITPFGSYYSFSSKRHLKSGGGLGLGLAYYFDQNWAAELSASQFETKQKRGQEKSVNGQYVTLNGLYYFRPGKSLRPFLSAGVGASHFSRTDDDNPNSQANIGIGGGAIYFIDHSIALRVGANDYYNLTGGGNNDIALQAGISFFFGGHSAEPKALGKGDQFAENTAAAESANQQVAEPAKAQKAQMKTSPDIKVDNDGIYVLPKKTENTSKVTSTSNSTIKTQQKPKVQSVKQKTTGQQEPDYSLYD